MACKYYDITISGLDIADATGNTIFPNLNGKVFVKYTDCDGIEQEVGYDTPGTYVDEFCANNNEPVLVGFYADNDFNIALNSTTTEEGNCSVPTETLCFEYIGVGPNILYQCSVQSEPTFYNGRNYWVLNGCPTDSWYNYPECPIIDDNNYIWWNGSSWVHSDTLGGGFVFTTLANPGLLPIQILGTYEWTSALINYATCAPQMLNSFLGPCVPLSTPTPTPTPTNTQTPTQTPTQTQTNTQTKTPTPTNTQTPTQTPSTTPISCGLGQIKVGSEYYYTDCCGNFITGLNNTGNVLEVSLNYNLPRSGVGRLNVPATTLCSSPTPTPTPTITPTNTATPTVTPTNTITPTQSVTPSVTPSNSPVTRLQNDCDVITLFDLGISCNVIQSPTESNPVGGILSVNVTGGTAPYSFSWVGGQRSQTLFGVPAGSYEVVVTDYAWPDGGPNGVSDYTATTICVLDGPIPTSTPTMTPTPSQTPPVQCVDLCFIAIAPFGIQNEGPIQFVCDGTQNGRFRWTSGRFDIVWNPISSRWEIYLAGTTTPAVIAYGGEGIFASTTLDLIPDSAWQVFGGDIDYSITMTRGECPEVIPLQVSVDVTNTSCQDLTNCNGSLTILAEDGYPPYSYSIDGGFTYSENNVYNNLCPNTYLVKVVDSFNNVYNSNESIGYDSATTTYQLTLVPGTATVTSVPNVSKTIVQPVTLVVTPPLPVGVSVTFGLTSTALRTINSPGAANSSVDWQVRKNGEFVIATVSPTTIVSQGTRPFCSVNDTQLINSTNYNSGPITITNGDVITMTSITTDTITNGQVSSQTNCTTNIKTEISAVILQPTIAGNNCSSVVGTSTQIVTNELTYVPTANPTSSRCFGYLYNFYAITGSTTQSLTSSSDWEVPSKTDFDNLLVSVSSDSRALRLVDTSTYWNASNTNATNSSGFGGIGDGVRNSTGFINQKVISLYKSRTPLSSTQDYHLALSSGALIATVSFGSARENGGPVRLVKNTTTLTPGQTGTYTGNDGKTYNTICIGTQEWMSEDLRETKYRGLSVIPNVTAQATWSGLITGAYCIYNNDPLNVIGCPQTPPPPTIYYPNLYFKNQVDNVTATFKVKYSIDNGVTWNTLINNGVGSFPNYNLYVNGVQVINGQTVYFGVTDMSDNDISFGIGQNSSDFDSLCGLSNPLILSNVSSNTMSYFNLAIDSSVYVNCYL